MVQALVNYYVRQGLESSVVDATGILLQRDPNNSFLQFWHAFGLYITEQTSKVLVYLLISLLIDSCTGYKNRVLGPSCGTHSRSMFLTWMLARLVVGIISTL